MPVRDVMQWAMVLAVPLMVAVVSAAMGGKFVTGVLRPGDHDILFSPLWCVPPLVVFPVIAIAYQQGWPVAMLLVLAVVMGLDQLVNLIDMDGNTAPVDQWVFMLTALAAAQFGRAKLRPLLVL